MRLSFTLWITLLALIAIASLGGCGSSFPHDSASIIWPADSQQQNLGTSPARGTLTLDPRDGHAPSVYESPIISSTLGVEQIAASWNADVPAGTGMWVHVRVRTDPDAAWSDWLLLGTAGEVLCPDPHRESPGLKVEVDILTSSTWFRDAQLRVTAAGNGPIKLHRLDVVRSLAFSRIAARVNRERVGGDPNWTKLRLPASVQLDVPFLSQKTSRPELAGRLCSPTSVAMVTQWAMGSQTTVEQLAEAAHDRTFDIYGNWPANIQAAWQFGVPGRLVRIGSLKDAWRLLAAGVPIVASIKAKPGELVGAPYTETDGHLIVLRGYDEHGNFLVSDPAASDSQKGQLTYAWRDVATAWLLNGRGTAYIFAKPGHSDLLDSLGQTPPPPEKPQW